MSTKYYLFKRSNGFYYLGFTDGNRRRWKSTKCNKKSDALAFLKSFKSESLVVRKPIRLSEFLDLYQVRVNGSIRTSTLRTYTSPGKYFISVIGDKLLTEYTVHDIENSEEFTTRSGKSRMVPVRVPTEGIQTERTLLKY